MTDRPEDYELVHYGVKGMKWGRRKKTLNKNYSQKDRDADVMDYGLGGRKRISKRMDKGKTLEKARRSEKIRKNIPNAVIATGALAYTSYIAFDTALSSPQGRAVIGKGVQFVGTHARGKTTQAAVMKGARFLDSIYGLGR